MQGDSQIVVSIRKIRLKTDRFAESGDSLFETGLPGECVAQIIEGPREGGVER